MDQIETDTEIEIYNKNINTNEIQNDNFEIINYKYEKNPNIKIIEEEFKLKNIDELIISTKKLTYSEKFISIIKLFLKKLLLFSSLRSLINLIKLLFKIKLDIRKINIEKLLDVIFDWKNLKSGLFLSIMPLIYDLLTEILFDLDKEENEIKQKILVFLSGFICAFIGISISERFKLFNYVVLSVLIRSLHSLIIVYLKKNEKNTESKPWSYLIFWLACCGFLFMVYYHPGFKPIRKLYFRYAFFDGNEKLEVKNFISNTNLIKKLKSETIKKIK
jgi:hypothetical protein